MATRRKMRRVKEDAVLGGVCSGMAYALGAPTWLVRFIWVFTIFFMGFGLLPYLLLWMLMPAWESKPEDYEQVTGG